MRAAHRLRFFHGYYDCYCYLPLYIFCGRHLLAARLRRANIDASAGAVAKVPRLRMTIVKRSDDVKGFVVLPRRWVVERAPSWFGRNQRLARDFENLAETLATFLTLASIQPALRRLAGA